MSIFNRKLKKRIKELESVMEVANANTDHYKRESEFQLDMRKQSLREYESLIQKVKREALDYCIQFGLKYASAPLIEKYLTSERTI